MKNKKKLEILSDQFSKIVIETDEENPVVVATIDKDVAEVKSGYRIRMTPTYD